MNKVLVLCFVHCLDGMGVASRLQVIYEPGRIDYTKYTLYMLRTSTHANLSITPELNLDLGPIDL